MGMELFEAGVVYVGGRATPADLRKVRTSQQSISRIEAGGQNTSVAILRRIGQALGMELHIGYRPKTFRLKHA
jgi:transcriptional regulator with XRE-family HTH domain